jgi:predicted permease
MMPAWLHRAWARLRAQFRSERLDAELQEDVATHLALLTDEYIRRGMRPDDARRAARLKFGSVTAATELHRETRAFRGIDIARTEVRWAWRAIRARGWQAVLALVLLATALAANTIVFSAADAFVFRPAPYPALDRLVAMGPEDRQGRPFGRDDISTRHLLSWREQTDVFAAIHGIFPGSPIHGISTQLTEPPASVRVTPGLLDMLGARPRWGRLLQHADAEAGAPPVAVMAADTARELFGDAKAAVGRRVLIERGMARRPAHEVEIVGVVDASFRFPSGRERVWLPLALTGPEAPVNMSNIALLAPGVSFEQAAFAVAQRNEGLQRAARVYRRGYILQRFTEMRGDKRYGGILLMLVAAAVCLLLIACANVASLELAASLVRGRAVAVHAALGAGRATLLRVRIIEVAMLVAASAAAAGFLAWTGVQTVTSTLPPSMAQPLMNAIDIDRRAVACLVMAAACAWAITLLPSVWRLTRTDLMDALRNDARFQAPAGAWARHTLVVGQIAATVMLLVGALLYSRSYAAKLDVDKGFDSRNLITLAVTAPPRAPLSGPPLRDAVAQTLARHPGIESVAQSGQFLPSTATGMFGPVLLDNMPSGLSAGISSFHVSADYFRTMRIPIVRGESLRDGGSIARVVVDEALADAFWPGQDPIGRRFGVKGAGMYRQRPDGTREDGSTFEVVGVAGAVRPDMTTIASGEGVYIFYVPIDPNGGATSFIARLHDLGQLPSVVSAIRAVAPHTLVKAETMDERYARLEGDMRLAAGTTAALGLFAAIVSALGIYAVMAFLVSTRTREIGVRMALGAGIHDIRREVFAVSMRFVLTGAVLGLGLAVAATRWIESQLYGVSATDPITYAVVVAGVLMIAALATWRPAIAAARVDPATALRHN